MIGMHGVFGWEKSKTKRERGEKEKDKGDEEKWKKKIIQEVRLGKQVSAEDNHLSIFIFSKPIYIKVIKHPMVSQNCKEVPALL